MEKGGVSNLVHVDVLGLVVKILLNEVVLASLGRSNEARRLGECRACSLVCHCYFFVSNKKTEKEEREKKKTVVRSQKPKSEKKSLSFQRPFFCFQTSFKTFQLTGHSKHKCAQHVLSLLIYHVEWSITVHNKETLQE